MSVYVKPSALFLGVFFSGSGGSNVMPSLGVCVFCVCFFVGGGGGGGEELEGGCKALCPSFFGGGGGGGL